MSAEEAAAKEAVWAQTVMLTQEVAALQDLLVEKGLTTRHELQARLTAKLGLVPKEKRRRLSAVTTGLKKLATRVSGGGTA